MQQGLLQSFWESSIILDEIIVLRKSYKDNSKVGLKFGETFIKEFIRANYMSSKIYHYIVSRFHKFFLNLNGYCFEIKRDEIYDKYMSIKRLVDRASEH